MQQQSQIRQVKYPRPPVDRVAHLFQVDELNGALIWRNNVLGGNGGVVIRAGTYVTGRSVPVNGSRVRISDAIFAIVHGFWAAPSRRKRPARFATRNCSDLPFPSVARLHEVLRVDGGLLIWNYRFPGVPFGKEAGRVQGAGYKMLMIDRKACLAHRVVFAMTHGRWPVGEVDHINGIKDDNRPENLREATRSQNNQNRGLIRTNTTGFKGVRWHNQHHNFQANIGVNGRALYLGQFTTAEDAATAYAAAALRLHGEFANVPGFMTPADQVANRGLKAA